MYKHGFPNARSTLCLPMWLFRGRECSTGAEEVTKLRKPEFSNDKRHFQVYHAPEWHIMHSMEGRHIPEQNENIYFDPSLGGMRFPYAEANLSSPCFKTIGLAQRGQTAHLRAANNNSYYENTQHRRRLEEGTTIKATVATSEPRTTKTTKPTRRIRARIAKRKTRTSRATKETE